jgi:hypothetical protein
VRQVRALVRPSFKNEELIMGELHLPKLWYAKAIEAKLKDKNL